MEEERKKAAEDLAVERVTAFARDTLLRLANAYDKACEKDATPAVHFLTGMHSILADLAAEETEEQRSVKIDVYLRAVERIGEGYGIPSMTVEEAEAL